MPGDFLTEINGQSLSRPDKAYELFMQLARGEPVVFTLERDGEVSQLNIQVD